MRRASTVVAVGASAPPGAYVVGELQPSLSVVRKRGEEASLIWSSRLCPVLHAMTLTLSRDRGSNSQGTEPSAENRARDPEAEASSNARQMLVRDSIRPCRIDISLHGLLS